MHQEILNKKQQELLPILAKFKNDFYLAGGTAIALQIGHRESIDFDLFTFDSFENTKLKQKIKKDLKIERILRDEMENLTFLTNQVQITFLQYPYQIEAEKEFKSYFRLPNLVTLGAMKVLALSRRAKWKDYVDLYFILEKEKIPLADIFKKSEEIFGSEFNEKILREQLGYFEDINYSEEVIYKDGLDVPDEEIKKSLLAFSLDYDRKNI